MSFIKFKTWINKQYFLVFLFSLVPSLFNGIHEYYHSTNPFSYELSNPYYYFMLIFIAIKFMFSNKITLFDICWMIALSMAIDFLGVYPSFCEWLTHESILKGFFAHLPAPGSSNVVNTVLIVISVLILLGMLLNQYIKTKLIDINKIFVVLGAILILSTTALFHLITLELGYRWIEKRETDNIQQIMKLDEIQFKTQCQLHNYICSSDGNPEPILSHIQPNSFQYCKDTLNNNKQVFMISNIGYIRYNGYGQRVGIFKDNQRILADFNNFEELWTHFLQNFFILISCAHTFWIYFTVFLILSHAHRKNKRVLITKE